MNEFIKIEKDAEASFSFAFGNEIRQSIIAPWRIPLLPLTIPLLLIKFYQTRKHVKRVNTIDCLFIFDLEKMRKNDQNAFVNEAINYTEKTITLGIGKPLINAEFDHKIKSRAEWNIDANEWNSALEKIILGMIKAYRPQKMIFVGKYPFAGIMSVIRKCNSIQNTFWISVRGDEKTVTERCNSFSKVQELKQFIEHDNVVRNTIFFDSKKSNLAKASIKYANKYGINTIKTPEHAEYLVLSKNDMNIIPVLLRNQTIVCSIDNNISQNKPIPNFALANFIQIDDGDFSKINKMFEYRKNKNGFSSAVMSVQAKLDVWLKNEI